MKIVVLVKQVPDSGAERTLRADDNTVDRGSANNVINEMDEYAIEEALTVKEAHGGEVTILTVGPDSATDAIRKALSMGADKAVHVSDEAIHGSDALLGPDALRRERLARAVDGLTARFGDGSVRPASVLGPRQRRIGYSQKPVKQEDDGDARL